jgi:hypothetical protein
MKKTKKNIKTDLSRKSKIFLWIKSTFWNPAAGLFLLVLILGISLRFYQIENIFTYGWDQARDAYQVNSLLQGKLLLEGPKTGIGNFHLGPLYFYLLAPYFLLANLDPIASQYLNITLNIVAFFVMFIVTKKLFSTRLAFLILCMYAVNGYVIIANRIPWNVSLMPAVSFLIYYFTYKTFREKSYKWSALLMTACGLFFHVHFTAVVFPIMIGILWLANKDKMKILRLLVTTLPFYLIWFVPTVIEYFMTDHSQYFLLRDFFKYYFVGFHLQFVLHRLPDVLIQFRTLLLLPGLMVYPLLLALGACYFFTSRKLYIKIIFAWLFATTFIFSIYGGPISDYYFFFTMPVIFYSFLLLLEVFYGLSKKTAIAFLIIYLSFYGYTNMQQILPLFEKHDGLSKQRIEVKSQIGKGEVLQFNEGDIKSYLYFFYTKKLDQL